MWRLGLYIIPQLLLLSRLSTAAVDSCYNETDYHGNMYCFGYCTGVNCSTPLEPPCTTACWTGTEDCCAVIGANFVMTNYQRNRLTFFDDWTATHEIFSEGGEVSTQSLAQVAVIPGTTSVLLPVANQIRMFGRDGGYLGVFYERPGTFFTLIRFQNSTLFYLYDYYANQIFQLEVDLTEGNITEKAMIQVSEDYTANDLATLPDGQLLVLLQKTKHGRSSVHKVVNGTELELITEIMFCVGDDVNGLEAFEDYTFAIACRNNYIFIYYALDGAPLLGYPETNLPSTIADAYSIRQGPRGLTYVSDFTGFNKPLVFYQTNLLGQLGSWGYLSTGMFLAFLEPTTYIGESSAEGFPEFSTAGVPYSITVAVRNNNGEPVQVPSQLEIRVTGYILMSNNVLTLSAREVVTYEATPEPGLFVFTMPNEQATLAYPDSSGNMFIHPAATEISDDPETFMFTASVVVGPFSQIINQAKFYVAPNIMSTTASIVALSAQSTIVAGESFAVLLYPNDANGNPIVTDFNASTITTTVDDVPTEPTSIVVGYPVAVNFNITRAGPRLIYLFNNGEQISNPVTAILQAGPASPSTSIASGGGLTSINVGNNTFDIVPKDQFGNTLQYSVEAAALKYVITVVPLPGCYKLSTLTQSYNNDGVWHVLYAIEGKCNSDLERAVVSISLDNSEILVEDAAGQIAQGPTMVYNLQVYEDEELSHATRSMLIVLGALGLAIATIFHGLMYFWRNTNVMKFSQRRFVHIIMAGAMLSFCDVIVRGLAPSNTSCIASVWFYHLGFTVAFSSLFAKAWRVTCIAHMTMRRMKISDQAVLQIILLCIVVCAGYLVLWTLFDRPIKEEHESDTGPDSHNVVTTTVTDMCTNGSQVGWVIGITVAELVGLLYGSMLAYQNRDIHDAFSESKWTGIAIYNMMVQMLFVSAMSLLFKVQYSDYNAYAIVTGIIIWLGTLSMMCLIAIPKFRSILSNEEVTIHDFSHHMSRSRNTNSGSFPHRANDTSTASAANLVYKDGRPVSTNPIYQTTASNYTGSF